MIQIGSGGNWQGATSDMCYMEEQSFMLLAAANVMWVICRSSAGVR